MPREQITIEDFSAGIITTVDAQDTPINASSWSLDQDPEAPQGVLRGREGDTAYIDSVNDHGASRTTWIVREDGKRDFLFYSKDSGKLCAITDYFSAKTYQNAATLTISLVTSLETFNRGARLGYGNNDVKYYGYIDHGQFGGSAPSGLQYLNSKLSAPILFPSVYKAVSNSSYSFAIEWQGKKVYRIDNNDGSFILSDKLFSSLQGIAFDGTYIYVYDNSSTYGIVYKLDTSLNVVTNYSISSWDGGAFGGSQAGLVTDMELSADNGTLFFAGQRAIGANSPWSSATAKFIFSFSLSGLTNGQSVTTTNRTPNLSASANDGSFYSVTASIYLPMRSLVKLQYNAEIGILGYTTTEMYYNSAAAHTAPDNFILVIDTSFTAGGYFTGTHSRMIGLNTGPDNGGAYMFNAAYASDGSKQDTLLITTWLNGRSASYNCKYGGGVARNVTINTTYGADYVWTAAGWKTLSSVTHAGENRALYDNIISGTVSWFKYDDVALEFGFLFFAAYNNEYAAVQSVDQTGRFYNMYTDKTGILSGSPYYVKYSDVGIVVSQSSVSGSIDNVKCYYKLCLYYQDSQLSPLQQSSPIAITIPAGNYAVQVVVSLKTSVLNSRVTGIGVFRAESSSSDSSPTSEYRLVEVIDVRNPWTLYANTNYGSFNTFSIIDIGTQGSTYEATSGVPESLPNNFMRYSIGCQGNGYLFVGQCANEEFDDNSISNIIFRSKKNAPDTFDWSNDFLVLPTRPQAMHFFKNMLFVFDVNTTYVIDPESFSLLQVLDGYGCADNNHVVSNNEMMVFANANNVYLYTGQNIAIISQAVNISQYSTVGGLTVYTHRGLLSTGYEMSIAFFSKKNSVVISYIKSGVTPKAFVFHAPSKSWHYWEIVSDLPDEPGTRSKSVFGDYLGNCYLSHDYGVVQLASGSRLSCTWISRQFNGGDVTILKKFVRIILNTPYGGTITAKYYALNANTTINTAFTSGVNLNDLTSKANNLWVKIVVGATEQLQGITIIFRRMIGLR
mgnify:CR=1 FL=1